MLSPSDARLVERDRAIPGLATVLDPEAFVGALRRVRSEAEGARAHGVYVRYKPGTNCLVAYRLELRGGPVVVNAKAHGPDAEVKLQNARRRPSVGGPLGPGRIVLDHCATVVSVYPNDAKLAALAGLADPAARSRLLGAVIPDLPAGWEGGFQDLRYNPERRHVSRVMTAPGRPAVLRLYAESGYAAAAHAARAFRSGGLLRLARWRGGSERHCAFAVEWLPGRALSDVLAHTDLGAGTLVTVGAALAALHAQTPRGLRCPSREAEMTTLHALATWLGVVCPALAAPAEDLAAHLVARLAHEPSERHPIHGDFYAKQVLLVDDRVAILDLDESRLGDPLADLGLFIAHLERDVLSGTLSRRRVELLSDALLDGYGAASGASIPPRIALYVALGLFGLAPHPFRTREPQWVNQTAALLERSRALLERHAGRVSGIPVQDLRCAKAGR